MSQPNNRLISRRQFSRQVAGAVASLAALSARGADDTNAGAIRGEPIAEKVGRDILAAGGNAIDAAVAAAFTAAIAAPHQTGIGGYGGHMTLALSSGKVSSIDFNTLAPAAARDDMFPLDPQSKVIGQKNSIGWLAAGVPGIPAGLQLALERYGTLPLQTVLQPAIDLAREGFPLTSGSAVAIRSTANQLVADPGSAALYFRDGKPLAANDQFVNPDLAKLLDSLAKDNSVESFYRGPIGEQIAAAFQNNGGLVTRADLAAYRAYEVEPLTMSWPDCTVYTAPLTAGGATIIQALLLMKDLKWADRDPASADALQLQVEAFRYAWQDRLEFLGDSPSSADRLARLLDPATIRSVAAQIEKTVAQKKPLPVRASTRPDQGTINLSVADRQGNLVAVTLTHGNSFGARVTVPGLGLTLGHGMSRFDPHPGHPNAPGPRKRPLNNMCPTIVAKNGRPTFAIGARGGRRIPNAVAEVLLQIVARGKSLTDAVAAPRMHTEGMLAVSFEKAWPAAQTEELKQRGYAVTTAASATVSAAGITDGGKTLVEAMR